MNIFDKFKKRFSRSTNDLDHLLDIDIKEIWNISNTNSFVIAMSEWVNKKSDYGEDIAALTPEEQTFYIVDSFQKEVNNGGFDQFLLNSSGVFAGEIVSSLLTIGANRTADIYKEAFTALPRKLPEDGEQRAALLDSLITEDISEVFDSCDQAFYKYPDNLDELLYQFAINNKESFI